MLLPSRSYSSVAEMMADMEADWRRRDILGGPNPKLPPRHLIKVERISRWEYGASYSLSNSYMTGRSRSEVIRDLRELMADEWVGLKDDPDDKLGPAMIQKRNALAVVFKGHP